MAFFLMTQQAAFDASWMNLGSETLLDQAHQFRCANVRLLLARFDDKVQNLVGQLVACLGPRLCGTNPASPPSSKADRA